MEQSELDKMIQKSQEISARVQNLAKMAKQQDRKLHKLQKQIDKLYYNKIEIPKQNKVKKFWKEFEDGDITEEDIRFGTVDCSDHLFLNNFTANEIIDYTIKKRTFLWKIEIEADDYVKFSTPYINIDRELGEIEYTVLTDFMKKNSRYELYDNKNEEYQLLDEKNGETLLKVIRESLDS